MVVGVGVGPGVRIIGRVVFVVVGASFGSVTGAGYWCTSSSATMDS